MKLLALNSSVDVADKHEGCSPSDSAEHDEKGKTHHQHVAKEEGGLHEA